MKKLLDDNKVWCTGCTACKSICTNNAIRMEKNEAGFKYPHIDLDVCTSCGLCSSICPILNNEVLCKKTAIRQMVGHTKNERLLADVASGGLFSEVAAQMIGEGAVVIGAAYDDKFVVRHIVCKDLETIKMLRGSKYVQSDIDGILGLVKNLLQKNVKVLFSGTPCQVAGLLSFLKAADVGIENLVTIDFFCHNVPSPKAFELYLDQKRKIKGNIRTIRFKDKKYGYSFPTLAIEYENGKTTYSTSQADPYMKAFLSRRISRECCFNCRFRKLHLSDITVGDMYSYNENSNGKGISKCIVWTEKGLSTLEKCDGLELFERNLTTMDEEAMPLQKPRDYIDFSLLEGTDEGLFYDKNFKVCLRDKIISGVRKILYYLGIHDLTKKIYKRK